MADVVIIDGSGGQAQDFDLETLLASTIGDHVNFKVMTTLPPETIQQWETLLGAATREVFEMMVGGELQPNANDGAGMEVTAVVGLAKQLSGLVTVQCSTACAGQIASAMLGMEISGLDRNALDAMGEICNMVAGSFKSKIPGMEDGCVLSVPTLIRGTDYKVRTVGRGVSLVNALSFNGAPLHIVVNVHQYFPEGTSVLVPAAAANPSAPVA